MGVNKRKKSKEKSGRTRSSSGRFEANKKQKMEEGAAETATTSANTLTPDDLSLDSAPAAPTASTSTGSSSSSDSATRPATTPENSVISGEELKALCEIQEPTALLLLDCRSPEQFLEGHIKYSINIPLKQAPEVIGLTSKLQVIQFVRDNCPKLFEHLNEAGFYKNVVIYDAECSSAKKSFHIALCNLLGGVITWNANCNTRCGLLEGGFKTFATRFPDLVGTDNSVCINWTIPGGTRRQVWFDHLEVGSGGGNVEDATVPSAPSVLVERMNELIVKLELAAAKVMDIINYKRKVSSMTAVRCVMAEEEDVELRVNAALPEDCKCRACREVFQGEVFQCIEGHCVCADCYDGRTFCPAMDCSLSYGEVSIRSRVAENLLNDTGFTIVCPFAGCEEWLPYPSMINHVKVCPMSHVTLTDGEITQRVLEVEGMIREENQKLDTLNREIEEGRRQVHHAMTVNPIGEQVPEELLRKMFSCHKSLMTATMGETMDMLYFKRHMLEDDNEAEEVEG